MRIVVDTNIVFSAILNTNGKLSRIILQPKSRLNFYTTDFLYEELNKYKGKLRALANYSAVAFQRAFTLITHKVKIISYQLIPPADFKKAVGLVHDIDEDDIEFVALAEHIKGRLWTGDTRLVNGLRRKNWNKIVTTSELYELVVKPKRRS